ncbi:MAG: proline--tRNA ligase [Candidatus Neomarinimicrobiota bacterium]|jgi:prolyl-tRNA synthetase|nr:proline--tRNA ligase [Candidatus Neomarinimicrobiota bacterium]MDD3965859.1 proline--tRNA ligase [Candidatus Neomarinimicrobiota bacterium]MDX9781039.1 proline--tRNA ligase [bacterium]
MSKGVTPQSKDYSKWYTDVVQKAELADYSPVKGCMVIRPYGYALWENIRNTLDAMFKATGHVNAYFPMLIPESFLKREAEHVEGFAPELAVVTHGGGKLLEEPLVIRPTSETIIWSMYKKWINSYRDLPLLINQWANVVRWEMRTRLFLRTTEFLWQEGHTAHASEKEAREEAYKMIDVYREFAESYMAMPVIVGKKTENEKFAGAVETYSIEAMMGDMRALQSGTSHYLGQNFAKAFDVTFQNENNELEYVYASSWGVSTRLVGALIMSHGDDKGLILPPHLAPYQVVIVPIYRDAAGRSAVMSFVNQISESLAKSAVRYHVDLRDTVSPGFKFNDWEMKGVPLRLEVGPRDVETGNVVLARRDNGEKKSLSKDSFLSTVTALLESIQKEMFQKRKSFREQNTIDIRDYEALKEVIGKGGFARAYWDGSGDDEKQIQEETKASIRCIPFEQDGTEGECFYTGRKTKKRVILAKAY